MKSRLSSYLLIFAPVVILAVAVFIGCNQESDGKNIKYTEFTDIRDGKTYKALKMPDGKIWMAENLNFVADSSWCYNNEDSNCAKYGRLYNWDAAMSACPAGWKLPTEQDWNRLIKTTGRSSAGRNLKSKPPIWDGRDKFGYSALSGGLRTWYGDYHYVGYGGYWWLATTRKNYFCMYMYSSHNYVTKAGTDSTISSEDRLVGHSVRCVQDVR